MTKPDTTTPHDVIHHSERLVHMTRQRVEEARQRLIESRAAAALQIQDADAVTTHLNAFQGARQS